jgi:hypothetical protein
MAGLTFHKTILIVCALMLALGLILTIFMNIRRAQAAASDAAFNSSRYFVSFSPDTVSTAQFLII